MARLYVNLGKADIAEDLLADLVRENPEESNRHIILGHFYVSRNLPDKAEEAYIKATEVDSKNPTPYMVLAGFYERSGQIEKLLPIYETALALNPEDAQILTAIAQYHLRQKDIEKAPQQTRSLMMLGALYEQKGELDLAEQYYRKTLEINPDFAPAANNLAYILTSQGGDINEALMLAKKAKELLPDDPSVMDTLGWIYYKKGLYESAIVEFSDSLEKLPDNPTIHYHLGAAFYQNGESTNAKIQLERALSLDGNFDGAEDAREMLKTL